jgi:hypothetical protein
MISSKVTSSLPLLGTTQFSVNANGIFRQNYSHKSNGVRRRKYWPFLCVDMVRNTVAQRVMRRETGFRYEVSHRISSLISTITVPNTTGNHQFIENSKVYCVTSGQETC